MYRCILIDDESKVRKVLRIKLEKHFPQLEIVAEASDATDAYDKIMEHKPALIFLDIAMPNETGFDLLYKFDKINFEIIFVTGYHDYVLDALRVSAVDYILKPIQNELLINAVNKAINRIDEKIDLENYSLLKHNIENAGTQDTKISIPGNDDYNYVEVSNIIRCEGWQKYTRIFLEDTEEIISSYNIGVFKKLLLSYDFYDVHKSHLVNKNHISRYEKAGNLVMSDDSVVPIARRRREAFLESYLND